MQICPNCFVLPVFCSQFSPDVDRREVALSPLLRAAHARHDAARRPALTPVRAAASNRQGEDRDAAPAAAMSPAPLLARLLPLLLATAGAAPAPAYSGKLVLALV